MHHRPDPDRQDSNCRLVRDVLAFLASNHPSIRPDDVAHLAEDLLDWTKLVEVDFVREWAKSIENMKSDSFEGIRESAKSREERFVGAETLRTLLKDARTSQDAFADLQCAGIVIGNLIQDSIHKTDAELGRVIVLQVNSFWNAAANQALKESGLGSIAACLPEYEPQAPELKEDQE